MFARLTTILGALSLLILSVQPAAAEDGLNPTQQQEVKDLVRELLLNNPEIIIQAVEEYRRQQQLVAKQKQNEALKQSREELVNDPDAPVGGNPEGDVVLVEFFDYQCGYCKRVVDQVASEVEQDQNVRWVFKEFPILGPASVYAARAALAANMQDKYLPFHLALMRLKGRLNEQKVLKVAEDVGLDVARLKQDMESAEVTGRLERNMDLADRLEIRGTPAFIIGDQLMPGAITVETMRKLIANAREGTAGG